MLEHSLTIAHIALLICILLKVWNIESYMDEWHRKGSK